MAVDIFDEMIAKEQFIEQIAIGVAPVNAGIAVGWSPAHTRSLMRDQGFADIVRDAQTRANGTVEEALFNRAVAGNVSAMQMWLFNREPDKWRDVKRIEVRSEHRVTVAAVESVKTGVLELLREHGVGAMQALNASPDEIIEGEIVDGGEE